jgi:hypothetical protein
MLKQILVVVVLGLVAAQAKNVALVIGGYGGGNSVEIITDKTTCSGTDSVPSIPNAPAGQIAGWFAEYASGKVYLCGGQDTDIHRECFTLVPGESWVHACEMKKDRRFAASVVMPDQRLVVLGGYNNKESWLDSVELSPAGECDFNLQTDWKMPRRIFDFCAVALNNTHIMIAGGSNPGVPQTTNVDILDTVSGTWHSVAPLKVARSAPACILTTVGGEEGVLLSGGFNTAMGEHLYDTLFYSLSAGTWKELELLNEDRMGHGIFHLGNDDAVTVVGGYNSQLMGGIETHAEGQGWTKRVSGLQFPRYFFGSCELPDTVLHC